MSQPRLRFDNPKAAIRPRCPEQTLASANCRPRRRCTVKFPKVTVRLHPSIPKPSLALQQIEVCGASIVYAPLRACWSPNAPTDDIASLDPAMGVA